MDQYITSGMYASAATYLYKCRSSPTRRAFFILLYIPTMSVFTTVESSSTTVSGTRKSYNIHVKRRLSNGEDDGSSPAKTTTSTFKSH